LSAVIDSEGECDGVALSLEWREFVDLTIWFPLYGLKAEDLKGRCRCTGGIANAILGPPDHLAQIVDTNRKGIVAARQVAKRR
jgi:hypothetical protein